MSEQEIAIFEARWRIISAEGIEKIFRISERRNDEHFDLQQYVKLYSTVHDVCASKKDIRERCYQRLFQNLTKFCIEMHDQIKSAHSNSPVIEFVKKWMAYEEIVLRWTLKIFKSFSAAQSLIKRNSNLEADLKEIFITNVFKKMDHELTMSFLSLIDSIRKGSTVVDTSILKNYVRFLSAFEVNFTESLYNQDLENKIIDSSVNFYNLLVPEILSNPYVLYLDCGLQKIKAEEEMLALFLPSTTSDKIIKRLKEVIFFSKTKELLEKQDGFIYLLKTQQNDLLKETYGIFSQNEKSLHILLTIFKSYIRDELNNLIIKFEQQLAPEDGPREVVAKTNFIEEFSQFQGWNIKLIMNSFNNCNLFNVIFKEVLEGIQSNNVNFNTSYLLPFYLDKFLKRSSGGSNSQIANNIIDQSMNIFSTLPEKDIFIQIHRSLLSNRILYEDFISMDSEKYLISKLKLQCGIEYTANVEAMILDYFSNKQLNDKLKQWMKEGGHGNENENENSRQNVNDIQFCVLSGENWPPLNIKKINLHQDLQYLTETLVTFYNTFFHKRILQWSYVNSILELDGKIGVNSKIHTIICNTFQGTILLSFNSFQNGTKKQLMEYTGIDDDKDFKLAIEPLIHAKIIMLLSPMDCEKEKEKVFSLNRKFSFSNKRVKILNYPKNEEVIKKDKIEDDRSWAIDGTIIRIMKAHQKISHNELIKNVLDQLDKFKIQIQTIKKRIDSLIEKDFIRRDKADPTVYHYSAN